MQEAIQSVVENSLSRCKPNGALPSTSTSDQLWTVQNIFMMWKLHQTAERVPKPPAKKAYQLIAKQREVVLNKLKHPLTPEEGYVSFADVETLDPGRPGEKSDDYSTLWTMGWAGTAGIALELLKYDEVAGGDAAVRELALKGADLYLKEETPHYRKSFTADRMVYVLELMLKAHEVSGKKAFLEKAEALAGDAVNMFFDESSPLPSRTLQDILPKTRASAI